MLALYPAARRMLAHRGQACPASLIAGFSVAALTLLSYRTYSSLLKWLGLCVFAYVRIVFFVQVPWGEVWREALVPRVEFSHG